MSTWTPRELNDWGALGGIVGRLAGDYWQVPAITGIDRIPGSDEMKHFGAALASYGSVALFHMVGITPEAQRLEATSFRPEWRCAATMSAKPISARFSGATRTTIDTRRSRRVLGAAVEPGRDVSRSPVCSTGAARRIPLLVVTSPQVKPDADRMGLTARIEAAGGTVLSGMCFYQSYAREMAEANGWKRLATNSAKLTNIIGGYGYQPALLSMAACVDAACAGGRIAS